MALDQNDVTFAAWLDAEIAAGVAARTSLFEKIVQDLIVAKNLIDLTRSSWADDDHVVHFSNRLPPYDWTVNDSSGAPTAALSGQRIFKAVVFYPGGGGEVDASTVSTSGYVAWDLDSHNVLLTGDTGVFLTSQRRSDKIESACQGRFKTSLHSVSTFSPYIGFSNSPNAGMPSSDGAWFRNGTNANTYKAVTRSGSTDRTTTDNLAGNYTGYDILRVENASAAVRFYINGTLVATHTVSLPNAVLMYAFCTMDNSTASWVTLDRLALIALADSNSP